MKKTFIFLTIFLIGSLLVQAAPALRGPFVVTQPDGTLLTIEQYGDEHYHWTTTTDGTMVVNTGRGYFLAQIDDEGELTATDVLAHEAEQRTSEELTLVEKQAIRRALFHQRGERRATASRRAMSIGGSYKYLPHNGNVRVLTILAAFSDLDFSVNEPAKAFDQLLNSDTQEDLDNHNQLNVASVQKYFETSSHGTFSPQFDVVGPVTLSNTMAYYGGTSATGNDDKFGEFCRDAISKVKEEGLVSDWTVYDNNGDGTVELVCIVFAGFGQNQGGDDNTLWAKASNRNLKVEGLPTISFFNCSCEKFHPQRPTYINGTGVFIHEMSHCMGLPDLYPTTDATRKVNNQSMESWDIMDYGIYNYNGFAPCLYNAWEQEVMGWTSIEALTEATQVSNVKSLEKGGKAYKIVNPNNEREYIVLENIQKSGLNSYAPGHGLLAYRVNYPSSTVNMIDYPNAIAGKPGIAIVPADGIMISGYQTENYKKDYGGSYTREQYRASMEADPFPGTEAVTSLSDNMQLPNFCFYQSSSQVPVGHYLYAISEDTESGTISFLYDTQETAIDVIRQVGEDSNDNMFYNLNGQRVSQPTRGLYIRNGKKYLLK